jgi:transposase
MWRCARAQVTALETLLAEQQRPFTQDLERLQTIPGVSQRVAETVVAEIGPRMEQFPTAGHLASWAGMCPGNCESAGKRQSGRTRQGNRWLRATLVQSAWAASHTKNTYLTARYRRLASRRGKKRALVALGHTLLIVIYHVLKEPTTYKELGSDYFDRLDIERTKRSLVRRLEQLGHEVKLTPRPQAA